MKGKIISLNSIVPVHGTITGIIEREIPAIVAFEIHSHVETRKWQRVFFQATDCLKTYDPQGLHQPATAIAAAGVGGEVEINEQETWAAYPHQDVYNAISAPTMYIKMAR